MELEKREDRYYITLTGEENPRGVLRAFAIAAHDLAGSNGTSTTIKPEDADRYIGQNSQGYLSLQMAYAEGRLVKTDVRPDSNGDLYISEIQYIRTHEGKTPETLFRKANKILQDKPELNTMPVAERVSPKTAPSKKGGIFDIFNRGKR